MVQKIVKIVNGYDMEQLQGLIDAVKNNPQMGQAMLITNVTWRSAFFSEAFVKDFIAGGIKNETSRSKPFRIPQDHPPELGGGKNQGPVAVEILLAALGHCVTVGFAQSATMLGIPMESLRSELDGDIDMQGMLGFPEMGAVRPGLQQIKVRYFVKSKASREQLEKVMKMGEDLSPVKDSLRAIKFSSQLFVE
jgi:uncharacterized OsmC-like protein